MQKEVQNLKSFLRTKLFNSSKYNSEGFFLNVQYLPFLLKYLLTFLTDEEGRSLISYQIQNLILEVAAKGVEGDKTLSLQEISTYIIKKIRTNSLYWERYSNPWHDIQLMNNPDLIKQEQKKEAQAIALYANQIDMIRVDRQESNTRLFKVNRKRIIDIDFQIVDFPNPDKIYQKIDFVLFGKLKEYGMTQYKGLKQMMVEYFILDICLSVQQRRKRKRNQLLDEQRQDKLVEDFKLTLQNASIELENLLIDEPKELQMISNIIKSFPILLRLQGDTNTRNKQVDMEKFQQSLTDEELQIIVQEWYQYYLLRELALKEINKPIFFSTESLSGCFNDFKQIQEIAEGWNKMFQSENIEKANKYKFNETSKINWTQDQYKLFLEGLITYFHLSVNNKKIASHMGKSIEPNHVKYIKGEYLRNMRLRRGNESKMEFMKNDLENFSVKIFEKTKNQKFKKPRKSRKKDDDELDDDSSY